MINFIICDDNLKFRSMVEIIVNSYMMKNKIEYKTHLFSDYDKTFENIIQKKIPLKIYILDIETPTKSGIDMARKIRKNDLNSVIIFLTGHEELGNIVMKNDLLFLSFINKFDNCEERLARVLDKALKVLGEKNLLSFKDNGTFYTLDINDILYISRDSFERKTIIKTNYCEFKVNKTLLELSKELGNNFIQTHRACLVNKKRVITYSKKQKEIIFDTGEKIDLISDSFKKEMIK